MKKVLIYSAVTASLLAVASPVLAAETVAPAPTSSQLPASPTAKAVKTNSSIPVYRLYNSRNQEHLYTTSTDEVSSLLSIYMSDWKYEGASWMAPKSSATAVFRVYNPKSGEHLYTKDAHEVSVLTSQYHWSSEGTAYYSESATAGRSNFRLYNPKAGIGAHFTTSSSYERDQLMKTGWKYEGIAWYGTKDPVYTTYQPVPTPMFHKDSLGYTVFTQQDSRWGNLLYGGDPIWDGGCGLVSTTMAINALRKTNFTPADTLPWANANGAIAWNDVGASVLRIAQHFGLNAWYVSADIATINRVLSQGGMVSVSGATSPNYLNGSPFTSVGHYVVIKKLLPNGQWMIFDSNNSNGREMNPNNNKAFDPNLIMRYQHYSAVAMYNK
ncbi:acid shock protein [Lactococcus termiticola]|uniref:Membrane protein n=1 Tax=Lactococcus termiticola TaxID=2169526 RepID=A0A2R5HK19_9LACT|nr:acid shock protein [Lactococcus termiticola]GBG96781.1 membrane protein [Lactococcus termiticola]